MSDKRFKAKTRQDFHLPRDKQSMWKRLQRTVANPRAALRRSTVLSEEERKQKELAERKQQETWDAFLDMLADAPAHSHLPQRDDGSAQVMESISPSNKTTINQEYGREGRLSAELTPYGVMMRHIVICKDFPAATPTAQCGNGRTRGGSFDVKKWGNKKVARHSSAI